MIEPFVDVDIENVFEGYPEPYKSSLLMIRDLISTTAQSLEGVGPLTESLKWGEPSYSTLKTKSGSPIRIDRFEESSIGIFFNCQTTLVESFRNIFKEDLEFSKNRAIVLDPNQALPLKELELCIGMALTYHKDKRHK